MCVFVCVRANVCVYIQQVLFFCFSKLVRLCRINIERYSTCLRLPYWSTALTNMLTTIVPVFSALEPIKSAVLIYSTKERVNDYRTGLKCSRTH